MTDYVNPRALAEMLGTTYPDVVAAMEQGVITAVRLPSGEWVVPRRAAYQLLGILNDPIVLNVEVDGQAFEVTLEATDDQVS